MVAGRKDGVTVINRACEKWLPWENWLPSQTVKIFKISPAKKVQLPRQLSLRAPEVFTHRLSLKASLSQTFPSTPKHGRSFPPRGSEIKPASGQGSGPSRMQGAAAAPEKASSRHSALAEVTREGACW